MAQTHNFSPNLYFISTHIMLILGYIQTESYSLKYRNFTYFFGASTYFVREPGNPPLKDLMAALLILVSKLNIIDDIEDFIVYSKCVSIRETNGILF